MAKHSPQQDLSRVRQIFRRFLYLDGDVVLNALAGLQGGDATEILESSLKAVGGNAGLTFSVLGAGITFGGKRSRETRREVHLRQTVHSAVSVLLDKLYTEDGVGLLTAETDVTPAHETKVVQAEAAISLPADRNLTAIPSRWEMPFRSRAARAMHARQESTSDGLVASANLSLSPDDTTTVLLALRGKYLLTDSVGDFGRRATLVGQVALVAREGEELHVETDPSGEVVIPRRANNGGGSTNRVLIRPFCIFR
jgi:hypothetical protein